MREPARQAAGNPAAAVPVDSAAAAGPAGPDAPLLVTDDGAVRWLTLNRPAAYNAFDETLKPLLLQAISAAAEDPAVRAVVVTGAGKAFSSGQDLKDHLRLMRDDPARAAATVTEFYNPMISAVRQAPKPVIAAVNGVAAGAGAGLALACDLRIAAESASLRTSFAGVALSADSGLTVTLPRLIGSGRARRMLLLDEPLDAATALAWGAVDRVVPDAELRAAAGELAGRFAAGPTLAYGWMKRSLDVSAESDFAAALDTEARAQLACFGSRDHAAALAAFAEKRRPEFQGR
ncbi:enoyl-CoA hydratase/isomerase family protein [Nakamurella aerolata]|uniref:Enoyl-CoA hydratase n=1 Tax=Nakamurella aerolata TaxID=1656892 RepID=A0A849A4X5_9ACTN|nr:enoyl-CoA hydratase-related protein [Nakamurella aerolata]NNG34178.1 enoyl-CoA hydratase [Nakamurella aerolata]